MQPILVYPNQSLRRVAEAVTARDISSGTLHALVLDMYEALDAGNGIGLAAPQIGVNKRVIVIKVLTPKHGCGEIMVNPVIVHSSEIKSVLNEGCLSFPEKFVNVERPSIVTVRYWDINGHPKVGVFQDLAAKCIQHEVDHLNGKLMIDYEEKI